MRIPLLRPNEGDEVETAPSDGARLEDGAAVAGRGGKGGVAEAVDLGELLAARS